MGTGAEVPEMWDAGWGGVGSVGGVSHAREDVHRGTWWEGPQRPLRPSPEAWELPKHGLKVFSFYRDQSQHNFVPCELSGWLVSNYIKSSPLSLTYSVWGIKN